MEEGEVRDASFQQDPEHFEFGCLSSEETWNYLDSQAREASKEVKVQVDEIVSLQIKGQKWWMCVGHKVDKHVPQKLIPLRD